MFRITAAVAVACAILSSEGAVAENPAVGVIADVGYPAVHDATASSNGGVFSSRTEAEPESSRRWFDPASESVNLLPSYSPAAMQGASALPDPTADWRFILDAHFWLPLKISGPTEVGPTTTDVDLDLKTILEDLKFTFQGGFELTNDEWTFLVWSVYFNVGADSNTSAPLGTREVKVNFKATIVDMAAGYRIGNWPLGDSGSATCGLDLTAGLTVYNLNLEVDTIGPFGTDLGINPDESWVDLMVGGRIVFEFSDKLSMALRGEIGGFGIGTSSDLSWNVSLLGKYELSPQVDLVAGFRYLSVDWDKGTGLQRIGYDWEIYGPILGVSINF